MNRARPVEILLVEDHPGDARLIRELLVTEGAGRFRLQIADRLAAGLAYLATGGFDVVLLDLALPDSHGFDTLAKTQAQFPDLPIIVLTGLDDEALAEQAVRKGAQDYLIKGQVQGDLLTRAIRYAIERKRAEEALVQANERLALAQRSAGAGMWDWDMTTGQLNWSPELFRLFGLLPGIDPTFDVWRGVLHPADRQLAEARINAAVRDHIPLSNEYRIVLPSGEVRWIHALGDTTYDERGEARRMSGICIDITERKLAEDALRWAEQRYRRLFEEAPLMYIITRNQGGLPVLEDCNPIFLSALGYARDEVIGRPLTDFYTPTSRTILQEDGYRRALEGTFGIEERELVARDGRIIPVLIEAVPEMDAHGNVTGTRAMFADITARKQAETELGRERILLRTVIDHLPDAVYVKDTAARKMLSNRADLDNIGVTSEAQILGKTDWELFPQDVAARFYADDQALLQTGRPILNSEELLVNIHGQQHWLLTSKLPLRDEGGRIIGIVGIGRDITERKQTEERIRQQLEELQRWYNVTLDRETRSLELKHEVNELLRRLGEPIRYPSAEQQ